MKRAGGLWLEWKGKEGKEKEGPGTLGWVGASGEGKWAKGGKSQGPGQGARGRCHDYRKPRGRPGSEFGGVELEGALCSLRRVEKHQGLAGETARIPHHYQPVLADLQPFEY